MNDLVLHFEVAECPSAKHTKAWGTSLVETMKESLAVVAASITAVSSNMSIKWVPSFGSSKKKHYNCVQRRKSCS